MTWSIPIGLLVIGFAIFVVLVGLYVCFKIIGVIVGGIFSFTFGLIAVVCLLIRDLLLAAIRMVVAAGQVVFAVGSVVLGRWSAAHTHMQAANRSVQGSFRRIANLPTRSVMRLSSATRAQRGSKVLSDPFTHWRVIDELPSGGSGARLLVAEPLAGNPHKVDKAVLKVFDLQAGSQLPQMIRESRALEGARRVGMVLEHGLDENRFWYAMPFIPGHHLGKAVTSLHASGNGLDGQSVERILSWLNDLLKTLETYHGAGLWHKDVKPENIIVNDRGAHLIDIGLVTPLHSAMTLTTHGTEYFRDPELVRQALRGSKVVDVDGARFDVYSVGAVLYAMMEDTFPAHGSLSRFMRPCPVAVQCIIRRAMADYNRRYTSAAQMRRDVQYMLGATDAMSVKPADLPSMHGEEPTDDKTVPLRAEGSGRRHTSAAPRSFWDFCTDVVQERRRQSDGRSVLKAQIKARRHASREARKQTRVALVAGLSAVALVMMLVELNSSPQPSPISAVETLAATTPLLDTAPIGEGKALVVNEVGGDLMAGERLASQLTSLGWDPVRDAESEARFRRSLPVAGTAAADFDERVRAAMVSLQLDAVAFVQSDQANPDKTWVLLMTADDRQRLQLSDQQ